jgi:hypothetical protein
MLTVPLLMAVLIDRIGRGVAGALVGSSVAFAVGGLLWGVPLLMASGGLNAYLAALGTQAGEDFAGVEMLYLNPTPRVAANALLRTLIFPWDSIALGSIIVGLAIAGAVALAIRDRRALALILVLALPYFGFHLLLQDMDFVRYALPLVPSIAFLAVSGLELVLRRAAVAATGALALWAVAIASTNLVAYASEPSPVARVVEAMRQESAAAGDVVLAMHQTFARPLEAEVVPIATRLAAPPRYEWLELTRYWRENNVRPLWFLADPRRTDLALIDPASRGARREFAWHFQSMSQLGGMRPAAVEWYRMSPPGWFAEEGWALTPEIAGISRVLQRGPHLGPITAWVRRRTGAARMTIGGRHLGAKTDPPVRFTATVDGRPAAEWEARPGFFLNVFDLPPGALSGTGALAKLDIRSTSSSGAPIETAIEQFNLQSAGAMMWGYGEGWNEAEYDPRRGLWRWTSERSAINVIDASTPITLRVLVESPLRNFDAPPTVRITAGGRVLHESHPVADNVIEVTVPLDLLQSAAGVVVIETDRVFVPAERGGPPDYRHLGLRIFGVNVAVPN